MLVQRLHDDNNALVAARFWWVLNYYGHTNARSDTYSDSNSYTDGLANSNTYGYADGNTDRNADTDRHAYT